MSPKYHFRQYTLYVADLPSEVTEINLFQIFSTTGTITSIRICKDKLSGESLGHAYVNFKSQEEAHHALDTLNVHMINGSPIRLMWSQRGPSIRKYNVSNIFIHYLPRDVDSKSFFDVCSIYGRVLSSKLAYKNSKPKGYGYVQYYDKVSAENAISYLNGCIWNGRQIFASPFKSKHSRNQAVNSNNPNCAYKTGFILDQPLEDIGVKVMRPITCTSSPEKHGGNDNMSCISSVIMSENEQSRAGNDCISPMCSKTVLDYEQFCSGNDSISSAHGERMAVNRQFWSGDDCISSFPGTDFILDSPNCDLTPILVPEKTWTDDGNFGVTEFNCVDSCTSGQVDLYINPAVYICVAVPRVHSNMYMYFIHNIIQTIALSMPFINV